MATCHILGDVEVILVYFILLHNCCMLCPIPISTVVCMCCCKVQTNFRSKLLCFCCLCPCYSFLFIVHFCTHPTDRYCFCHSLSLTEGMVGENVEGPFFQNTTPAKAPTAHTDEEEEEDMVRKTLLSEALRSESSPQPSLATLLCFV